MLRDLKFAARSLRRTPGFALITILTLALGFGGTVTMFAAVNAAFLKPLPYPDEGTLVKIYQRAATRSDIRVPLPIARAWSETNRSFSGLAAYLSGAEVNVSAGRDATRARVSRVTSQFFAAMQVGPIRGRLFSAADVRPGAETSAVISYALWQRLFGGRADVLTEPLRIESLPVPIIGVMPEGFAFPDDTDFWVAVEREGPDAYGSSTAHNFDVVGRLRTGTAPGSAERDLLAIAHDMQTRDPEMAAEHHGVAVLPLRTDLLGPQASVVLIGLGAVLCVLLISCVNVANLMLARSVSLESQTGIKLALGAGRRAIVRSVIAEGLVLSFTAAAVGMLVGQWGTSLVTAITPVSVTGGETLAVDWRVAALTLAVTTAAGVLCGLLPSLRAARVDVRQTLAIGSRTVASSPHRAMSTLVGLEVALAFVLLVGAGLLVRTYASLERVDSGFRTEGLTLASTSLGFLSSSPYDRADVRRDFFQKLDRAVRDIPGVTRVGLTAILPLGFSPNGQFEIRGLPTILTGMHYRLIGGDYFQALEIPLRSGRVISRADDAAHPRIIVINESLAHGVFAGANPIGQQIRMPGMDGGDDAFATIVGVVGDVHQFGPSRPPVPEVYFPYLQRPWRTYAMTLVVAATGPDGELIRQIRREVQSIDAAVPPVFSTMAVRMAKVVEPVRFRATLLTALSVMALVLSGIGIVGVVSYGVARRQHEIGIRVALGATPRAIAGLVLRSGFAPVIAGGVVGSLAALVLARSLTQFLFEVQPRDGRALAGAAAALVFTALLANWLPARKAARTDPMVALRN